MEKFAVYFIPEGEFYDLGSSIIGYDLRAPTRQTLARPDVREKLPGFSEEWTSRCKQYGFHMTVTDAIEFKMGAIVEIEHEIKGILECFNPSNPFTLTALDDNFVDFFGPEKNAVVLRYKPSENLKILHAVLVSRLHPVGLGSGYLRQYLRSPERYTEKPHHIARIKKFFSPTIFDSYSPHFTLLDPYSGQDRESLKKVISDLFSKHTQITISSLSLLLQFTPERNWIIHKEFHIGRQTLRKAEGTEMIPTINLEEKLGEIDKPWSPVEIARLNDQVVRMALLEGEFHWHKHANEDELFYVYRGSIVIQFRDQPDITLREGEMAVIPKGVEHCPKSTEPSYVLLFEPYVLQTRGD
jgi:mannose-6-phosphate isomerase-like protein (cupin superfamily)